MLGLTNLTTALWKFPGDAGGDVFYLIAHTRLYLAQPTKCDKDIRP